MLEAMIEPGILGSLSKTLEDRFKIETPGFVSVPGFDFSRTGKSG